MRLDINSVKGKLRASMPPGRYSRLLLAPAGLFCFVLLYLLVALSPVAFGSTARDVVVTIPLQSTAEQAGRILKQNELVRSSLVFSIYARWSGMDARIKAGDYQLNNGLSTPEVLRELVDGRLAEQSFTIPEGYTTAQVADLLVSKGLINRDNFFSAVANDSFPYSFIQGLPKDDKRLEGYLFPDTYQVSRGSNVDFIIDMMLKRFQKEIDQLNYPAQASKLGLTLNEAVTVASMVEREARIDKERTLIAGVIYNRMRKSMPLQIDATVQYALGTSKPKLYYKDLEVNSPYNTYRIRGLPPGPIAMPGSSSLMAAVHPAQTDYLYYVAKTDGSHAFATTLAEHNANKERYQQ